MSANSADLKFTIRLEMRSDWHIGTGAGIPGSIDALLARDGDGFPCVPAKTIVGIWRDALETLTLGLDNGHEKNSYWQKWVDVIFGSQPNQLKRDEVRELANQGKLTPRPAILSIQPGRLNEHLRNAIGVDTQLRQALTFIKPNTQINSKSGTAQTESLRFTEMGRIGTVVEAEFKLDFDLLENVTDAQKGLIWGLLVASAGLAERIGGNRRRGSGKCEMLVVGGVSQPKAVEILRSAQDIESVLPAVARGSVSAQYVADITPHLTTSTEHVEDGAEPSKTSESVTIVEWKKINYSLTLHTPVAIVTNTLGNVSETLDFIPGTYLLPHITKALGKGISKHIASGDFQVSPATIEVGGERGLPVPKVIHYHKVDGGFDKAKTVYNGLKEPLEGGEQKKNFREGYVSSLEENGKTLPAYERTNKILLMHNTVDDPVQRPTENVGGVFSREAIKARTTLRGEVRFKKSIEEEVKSLANHKSYVRLGTSKKDDYGLAELLLETLEDDTSSASVNNELIIYLESDVLLRNGNLRQTNLVGDLKLELENTLGTNVLELKDSLIQVRRIESWHEGWGFPRPTLTAMAAGSVAVFTINDSENLTDEKPPALETALQRVERSGIGERRGEGYGRIRFNPPILMSEINKEWTVASKNGNVEEKKKQQDELRTKAIEQLKAEIKHAETLKEFISTVELSAWRDELARAVLKIANDKDKRKEIFGFEIQGNESIPSLSQIGGLRSAIGRLKVDGSNKNIVTEWLKHLEATENRRNKWDSKSEQGTDKLKRIRELINDENKVWLILCETKLAGLRVCNAPCELIQSGDSLRKKLWAEAMKSLFDACARAHKRDTEDK